jgi:hypothetical protein
MRRLLSWWRSGSRRSAIIRAVEQGNEQVFPFLAARISERRIRRQLDGLRGSAAESDASSFRDLSEELLTKYHERERTRKREIEEKARVNVIGVSISFSILFGALGLVSDSGPLVTGQLRLPIVLMISLGFFYVLLAGYASLRAVRTGEWHDLALETERQLQGGPQEWRREILVECILRNRLETLIRINYFEASYLAFRNGATMLAIGIFSALVASLR